MVMDSYITAEISAAAVAANIAYIRSVLRGGAKLCAVVKADALGHGVDLLWATIARSADCLAVATPAEAVQLRELGYAGPLLQLLAPCAQADSRQFADDLADLIARRVTLTICAEDEIAPIASAAAKAAAPAEVHVRVDTGLGLAGAPPEQALRLIEKVRHSKALRLRGLYTHLATADDADKSGALRTESAAGDTHAMEQLRVFRALVDQVPRREELIVHAANSAAAIALPQSHLDMVRCGVAIMGCHLGYHSLKDRPPLRPAMRVRAPLTQVKQLPAGVAVGYGLTRKLHRPSVVGLVPIGYGDGYLRSLSNRAVMRVGGRDVSALGRVSMDQVIVDLTDVPGAQAGDVVEIVSPDPAALNSLENLALLAGTVPQEIACRLACRVRRVLAED
jgi:alanine racemase